MGYVYVRPPLQPQEQKEHYMSGDGKRQVFPEQDINSTRTDMVAKNANDWWNIWRNMPFVERGRELSDQLDIDFERQTGVKRNLFMI